MASSAFDLIGLSDLRNDPRYRNIDGQVDNGPQLTVAVIDTGISGSHPDLDDNFLAYYDFFDETQNDRVPVDQVVQVTNVEDTVDFNGHGTHVAGTIGAEDSNIGVAPATRLISLNPFDSVAGTVPITATNNSLTWVKENRIGTINEQDYRIVAVNMSLGGGIFTAAAEINTLPADHPNRIRAEIVEELETAGIAVISANGNDYDEQAIARFLEGEAIPLKNIGAPAIYSTLAVGALNSETSDLTIFSQRLDTPNAIFAPGDDILSTVPIGGNYDGLDDNFDGRARLPGTSMASPHVAGAVALMQDAALTFGNGTDLLSTAEIQEILLQTADTITDNINYAPIVLDLDEDGIGDVSIPVESTGENYLRLNVYEAIQEVQRRVSDVVVPIPDELDPDGTLAGAVSLENDLGFNLTDLTTFTIVDTAIIGEAAEGPNDVDLFSFIMSDDGGTVTIETGVDDPTDPVDTILRLFDADGNELALDNDGGEGSFSRIEAILEGGEYFVGVSGFNNSNYNPEVPDSGISGEIGTYAIGFQFAPDFVSFSDQNGTISTAPFPTNLVFDDIETQTAQFDIGTDPLVGFSDRVAVGRTDVDILRFDVTTPGLMVMETSVGSDPSNPVDSILRLFDANDNQIESDDDGGEGLFSRIETFLDIGTYYIGVSGYDNSQYDPNSLADRIGGSTGTTSLEFQFQPQGNLDPNGVRFGATQIELIPGQVGNLFGLIGSDFGIQVNDADVDLFEFIAPQDGRLLLDTDTPFGPGFNNGTDTLEFADTVLQLFDSNGNVIAFSDDDPAQNSAGDLVEFDTDPFNLFTPTIDAFGNLIGHDVDSFTIADVIGGETYYIGVSGYGNSNYSIDNLDGRNTNATGGFYNLLATYITSADTDGTIADAATASLSAAVIGNIGFDGAIEVGNQDVDFYRIQTTQGGLLNIDIDAFNNTTFTNPVDSIISLFDAEGNLLAFNDDATSPFSLDSELQYLIDANQSYFIAVSGFGNSDIDPTVAGSGSGGAVGDYILNTEVLVQQTTNPDNIYAAAFNNALSNNNNSFEALDLDIDRELFGPTFGQFDTSELNVLQVGTSVSSVLGEDPQGSSQFFSSFSNLYINEASPAIFGDTLNNNLPTGADDADYFRISFSEAGRFDLRTIVTSTGLGGSEANTLLRLFDNGLNPITATTSTIGLPGVDSRVLVNIETPGDYWLVVLPDGSAAERFDLQTHSFGDLTNQELLEFSASQGEYRLSAEEFVFQAVSSPTEEDRAFSLQFNDALNLDGLSLYDGPDLENPVGSSITAIDDDGNVVRGSLVADDATNTVFFVPTTPLAASSYTLTYRGEDFVTQFGSQNSQLQSQETLDGDGDGTAGGDLTTSVSVANTGDVLVSIPSFARGPGQSVDIGAGVGLPIRVSNADGFRDVRLRLEYDADLLTITDAVLANGLPGDWQILNVDITDSQVLVDLAGSTPLPAGEAALVNLIAEVPETAVFNDSQVLRVSGGATDGNSNLIALASTASVHKVAFIADANASGTIDFTDIRALSALQSPGNPTAGLDQFDLTDPTLLGDIVPDGSIDFADLQSIAREALLSEGSDLIPDIDIAIDPAAIGPDPILSLSDISNVQAGQTASSTISVVGDSENLASFTLTVNYATDLLDITAEDVVLSQQLIDAGFVPLDTLQAPVVDDTAGTISFGSFTADDGLTESDVPLVTLNFQVAQNAVPGASGFLEIDLSSTAGDNRNNQFLATGPNANLFFEDGTITISAGSAQGFFDYEQFLRFQNPSATAPTDEVDGLPLVQFFDEEYYRSQYADVVAAVNAGVFASGYEHFVNFGLTEGRNPSVLFNEAFYLNNNLDVAQAIATGTVDSGLEHFLNFGHEEGRDPSSLFSQSAYLANNPDVAVAVNGGLFQSAFEHYIEFGADEGRLPLLSLYNEAYYLQNNPDVAAAVANDAFADGFEHFAIFGQREGRSPSTLYNETTYLSLNPDVSAAVAADSFSSGFEHYLAFGRAEGRGT